MKKTIIAFFVFILIPLSGCNLNQTSNTNQTKKDSELENYIQENQNLKKEIDTLKNEIKNIKASESENLTEELKKFNFENILTKNLYKDHYSNWRLIEAKNNIERYEIEKELYNYSKEIPYKTLFFRNDQYFLMNNEDHNLRTGGLVGQWEILVDNNILKFFLDNGDFIQYKILALDDNLLEIEKIDDQEIQGVNVFPKKEGESPKWKLFSNQKISFQYPNTFCGTNWQESWDTNSCDQEWIIKEVDSQIMIQPSYSSFGYEFGGDIIISFLDENEFIEIIKDAQEERLIKNKYKIYSKKNIDGYPDKIDEYYIEKKGNYIKVTNNFPNRYRKYTKYLLESIK